MAIVNSIRLLGDQFSDRRIIEKFITTLLENYESKISSLEDSRDLSTISLSELTNVIYAQEKRRASMQEEHLECAFQARSKESLSSSSSKGKKNWNKRIEKSIRDSLEIVERKKIHNALITFNVELKKNLNTWRESGRTKGSNNNSRMCKLKQLMEIKLRRSFNNVKKSWLINSGYKNHMTSNDSTFKVIDRSFTSRIRIGNG
ncbi:Integrase, catalytic core [Gossypium australe]|uniref:Integrase, catalytic core n=1 Tax=Gossypium australe TaxID=47621 RepID=A0A5B6X1U2_9ROSI|nr:Integrase, catalytic core [Gossypium australe]